MSRIHKHFFLRMSLVVAVLMLFVACDSHVPSVTSSAKATAAASTPESDAPLDFDDSSPTEAQPKLKTVVLYVGAHEVISEMAISPTEQQTGMMWRTEMGENEGMIFVSSRRRSHGFWMRNTLVPLSIAYIETDGRISSIHKMHPKDENLVESKSQTVRFALEMNQGWFEKNGIGEGVAIATEHGSLEDYFIK
ncbi:DUF192 domain-containing protein [Verrucomicrobia bacterium]|nr:DUF192 domain-containing protein [Verrucomicrobiota bacterium]